MQNLWERNAAWGLPERAPKGPQKYSKLFLSTLSGQVCTAG